MYQRREYLQFQKLRCAVKRVDSCMRANGHGTLFAFANVHFLEVLFKRPAPNTFIQITTTQILFHNRVASLTRSSATKQRGHATKEHTHSHLLLEASHACVLTIKQQTKAKDPIMNQSQTRTHARSTMENVSSHRHHAHLIQTPAFPGGHAQQ